MDLTDGVWLDGYVCSLLLLTWWVLGMYFPVFFFNLITQFLYIFFKLYTNLF